jgi:cytidylate kinase
MPELVILVNGRPGSGKTSLATAPAAELAVPLIVKDAIKESAHDRDLSPLTSPGRVRWRNRAHR